MTPAATLALAFGMSMDAFAAPVGTGRHLSRSSLREAGDLGVAAEPRAIGTSVLASHLSGG